MYRCNNTNILFIYVTDNILENTSLKLRNFDYTRHMQDKPFLNFMELTNFVAIILRSYAHSCVYRHTQSRTRTHILQIVDLTTVILAGKF